MGYIKTLPLPPPRCRSVPHQLPPASAVCKNLLNRDFYADKLNRKWVPDISYMHTKQGVLYLSMIRDTES